jgi:adenosine deaminase
VKAGSADNLERFVKAIPKVELHLHLEGAIPLETLFNFIQREGTELSIKSVDDLRKRLAYTDFAHFIDVWVWKNSFIRDERDFDEIAYQVLRDLSAQNVKYVEAFYSPGDYVGRGFSVEGITECLLEGKERARRDFGVRCELIVDVIRGDGPDVALRRLDEVETYLGKGVIGVGLGGSEADFPADPYEGVFREARARGFNLTAHAGEAAGPESIWACIDKLGVERIGHGVRPHEDPRLVSLLKERQVPLEMCVTSNVRTGVVESVEAHPIKQYFQQGLIVTVNADDPTMFDTSISQEYLILAQELGFTADELRTLSLSGVEASFLPADDKVLMRSQFEKEWEQVLNKYHLNSGRGEG